MQRTNHGDTQSGPANSSASGFYPMGSNPAVGGMQASPAAGRSWPTLAELFSAMKRRLVLATFLGMLVGLAAGAAVWLAMPAGKHQVRALVEMKPFTPVLGKGGGEGNEFDSFKQNQMILIKTRPLLTRVVGNPKVSRLPLIQTSDDPIRFLEEQLRLRWEAPQMLAVMMNGDDPQSLKVILDALLVAYLEDSTSEEIKTRGEKRKKLELMLKEQDRMIDNASKRMNNMLKLGAGPTPEVMALQYQSTQTLLNGTYADIAKNEKDIAELDRRRRQAKAVLESVDAMSIDRDELEKAVIASDVLRDKYIERAKKAEEVKQLSLKLLPGSSALVQREGELLQIEAEIAAAIKKEKPAIEAEWRLLRKRDLQYKHKEIEEDFAAKNIQKSELATAKKKHEEDLTILRESQAAAMQGDDLTPLKARRDLIKNDLDLLSLAEKSDSRITVREESHISLNQNLRQKVLLALAAAAFAGLLVMIAVAFLEWRSRRVDSVEQVVNELGIRVIGTIPAFPSKASLKSGDAVTSQNWRFILNESVNSTRTMLLHTAKAQSMQVIMVSSAMQGEGKTSLASQLGTSMATAGLRTLILDCDLRNPSMHKLFDAPLTPGCSEILCQEVDVSDAVQPTSVPNLWLIPAGQCSNRVISSLAQGHPLETLFNRLRGQFDFIVVDSCPVLPVADSLLVGQHVDGVVISILQDISQLPKVMTASEKLTQLNIPLLGAVVNGVKPDVHAYGYNYVKQLPA